MDYFATVKELWEDRQHLCRLFLFLWLVLPLPVVSGNPEDVLISCPGISSFSIQRTLSEMQNLWWHLNLLHQNLTFNLSQVIMIILEAPLQAVRELSAISTNGANSSWMKF